MDLLDPVGQKSQEFVSGCPISTCIPGDRDGVWHRSTSTKDGTLCPVSCSSALDHLHWSMDEMVFLDGGDAGALGLGVNVMAEVPGGMVT